MFKLMFYLGTILSTVVDSSSPPLKQQANPSQSLGRVAEESCHPSVHPHSYKAAHANDRLSPWLKN